MCAPDTVGVLANAVSNIIGIQAQNQTIKKEYQAAKYNSELALSKAKEAENNALLEKQEGIEQSRLKKMEGIRQANAQRARDMAGNVDLTSDTSFYNYDDILNANFAEAQTLKNKYDLQADKYFEQSSDYRKKASDIINDYNAKQYRTGIQGLGYMSKVASGWYKKFGK